jgi:hypothetical protein
MLGWTARFQRASCADVNALNHERAGCARSNEHDAPLELFTVGRADPW